MDELEIKAEIILAELKEQVISFFEQNKLEEAKLFLDQYIKLAPTRVDRYSLEAMVRAGEGNWDLAKKVLADGLSHHPLSFDLLYNLGYIYEEEQETIEAYHIYMKARYVAKREEEKEDIASALTRLVPRIKGSVITKDDEISTIIIADKRQLTLTSKVDDLLKRKKTLQAIERHIGKEVESVLEIGFYDGIISKNLNYFGYEVTAVDRIKERIINVIAKEWHDNLLQPRQKVAKFYQEPVDLGWLKKIPEFDTIVFASPDDLSAFKASEDQKAALIESLLTKATKQLFLRVASSPSKTHLSIKDLEKAHVLRDYNVRVLTNFQEDDENFILCLINKEANLGVFTVPKGAAAKTSKSTLIDVELAKCTDLYGAEYINDKQQFGEFLRQYSKNEDLRYQDSILKEYYDVFTPKNLEETLFANSGRAPRLGKGWIGYPWYWTERVKVKFASNRGETRPGGNHNFGPNSQEFGQAEFGRLIGLYKLLEKHGYHPELFSDGYISGYLLLKDDDYRFVVTEGQHRVACLAALGYKNIRCRFTQKPEYPKVVDFDEIKKWPQVANGTYSTNLATKVFNRFFEKGVGEDRFNFKR